jgi:hypothetical protein
VQVSGPPRQSSILATRICCALQNGSKPSGPPKSLHCWLEVSWTPYTHALMHRSVDLVVPAVLPRTCRFLMVGIPGHYKANKSVSFAELRGFRDRVRLAGGSDDEEEEEEEEEEVPVPARAKRERWAAAPTAAQITCRYFARRSVCSGVAVCSACTACSVQKAAFCALF